MGAISSRNYRGGLETTMPGGSGYGRAPALDAGSAWFEFARETPKKKRSESEGLSGRDAAQDARQAAQDAMLFAQRDALTRPAPTKQVTIGQWSGTVRAPEHFTGAQRQVHLPQNAEAQPTARDGYRELLEAQDEEEYSNEGRRRAASMGRG